MVAVVRADVSHLAAHSANSLDGGYHYPKPEIPFDGYVYEKPQVSFELPQQGYVYEKPAQPLIYPEQKPVVIITPAPTTPRPLPTVSS